MADETEQEETERQNALREACLNNARDLLTAARAALDAGVDNAAFHLAALALEEIGKSDIRSLELMSRRDVKSGYKEPNLNFDTDDHEKKLFYAIWGPSFGREKLSGDQIKKNQGLAKSIHENRLDYLYVNPDSPTSWKDKMREGEAKSLIEFVESRLKLEEKARGPLRVLSDEEKTELDWFLRMNEDPDRRKELWGHKSQEKLIELGSIAEWIKWAKGVYDKNQEDMRALFQQEITRPRPDEQEAKKPKWRIKVRVVSPSHAIRKKPLNELNKYSDFIKLYYVDAHTLTLELLFPKAVPVGALWDTGWGIARNFIIAMNIATQGLFWWNIKLDPARYYEEIWDLENNAGVTIVAGPVLEMNWRDKRMVYGDTEVSITMLVFDFLMDNWRPGVDTYFNDYAAAMSIYAKNDIHLRVEATAFEHFFKALKRAMLENKDWDGTSDFGEAYVKRTKHFHPEVTPDMKKWFPIALELESTHNVTVPITITQVHMMKIYCDAYFLLLAKEFEEKKRGAEIRFEMESSDDAKPASPSPETK